MVLWETTNREGTPLVVTGLRFAYRRIRHAMQVLRESERTDAEKEEEAAKWSAPLNRDSSPALPDAFVASMAQDRG